MSSLHLKSPELNSQKESSIRVAMLCWLLLLLMSYLAIRAASTPPAPVAAKAVATDFSAIRARQVLETFAQRPHPIGSPEHELVRQTLFRHMESLGLHPVTETYTAIVAEGQNVVAAKISNLIGRMPGRDNSRAVVLVAHYDSVDRAPGAGDDGGGVAAILETVRALQAGPRLKNDVIVVFTDGEEDGLLGAQAATVHDPWLRQAGVLFNFEGRGDHGPSSLFETSDGNRSIVRQFRKSVSAPAGSSLAYALYKLLPNDTDFTVFRQAGLAGLNFAWDAGLQAYHSRLDTVANLDPGSLQQDGMFALGLTRDFGDLDLNQFRLRDQQDAVFFNSFGMHMVEYPVSWVMPLAVAESLIFFSILAIGIAKSRCTPGAIGKATAASAVILLAIPLVMTAVHWCFITAMRLLARRELLLGDTPSNTLCLLGLMLVGGWVALMCVSGLLRRLGTIPLAAGGLLIVWLLVVVMTKQLPTGSYLLFWPFLGGVSALGWMVLGPDLGLSATAVALIGAIPAVVLLAPTMSAFFIGLTLNPMLVLLNGLLLAAGCLLAAPFLRLLAPTGHLRRVLSFVALAAGVCLIASAVLSRPSAAHPLQDSLVYMADADTGKAEWATYDRKVDAWTMQKLTSSPNVGTRLSEWRAQSKVLWKDAGVAAGLVPPTARVLQSTVEGVTRTLHLQLQAPDRARLIRLTLPAGASILSAQVNGEPLPDLFGDKTTRQSLRMLNLYGFGIDPVDVLLRVASTSCDAVVSGHSSGLIGVLPRPAAYMAGPGSDQTIVMRKVHLC